MPHGRPGRTGRLAPFVKVRFPRINSEPVTRKSFAETVEPQYPICCRLTGELEYRAQLCRAGLAANLRVVANAANADRQRGSEKKERKRRGGGVSFAGCTREAWLRS